MPTLTCADVHGRAGHIRCAMGKRNMATFRAARTPIRAVNGTSVERRRAGEAYLRWAIRSAVYSDPAKPSASRENCSTRISVFPTSAVEPC